ncbi:MAG TPA: RidA family protein [Burkholderiales bacterium]|nr:RidA family protein [Burkholderiales bacterium]
MNTSSRTAVSPASGWTDKLTYSAAVRAGRLLILSGMTASGPDGRVACDGDLAGQARYIYLEKMLPVLRAAGLDFGDVVETVDYVTTFEGYERTAQVRREIFGGAPFPAATGVQVAGLIRRGALIEIRAVALLKDGA